MMDSGIHIAGLPIGWVTTTLGEVSDLVRGVSYVKEESDNRPKEGHVPILRANNIGVELSFEDLVYVPLHRVKDEQYIREGDILIAMSSGSKNLVGKAAQAKWGFCGGFGAFCGLVRASRLLEDRYVGLYLKTPSYREAISRLSSGVNINNLKRDNIESLRLPLPPLGEQRRIVAKIEELFAKLDAGVDALNKVKAQLRLYRQAVLRDAFNGTLTREWREAHKSELEPASALLERIREERAKFPISGRSQKHQRISQHLPRLPNGWVWTTGDTIFPFVTSGSRGWAKYYSNNGSLFLRIGNLSYDSIRLDLSRVQKVQPPSGIEGTRTRVAVRDILISITGDIGMIALAPNSLGDAYVNQHIALARPISAVNAAYVAWFLANPWGGRRQLAKLQRGATKTGIGLNDIRSLAIPLPPLPQQSQIVEEIERRFSMADQAEQIAERAMAQGRQLRQTILKSAFEGRLVPQDPSDEPAEKLLQRIREERSQLERKGKTRPRKNRRTQQMRLM
ncbi:MAG: restriction endonuclease subunit S [Chloroflexota bacterium]|nr:restriction endonuclease subunit S [Chloroflexota bacterium]